MSIYQLVNEIDSKELVLPAIQRDFVWDQGRIRKLFDSILRGYPIGIVLLWETYQPIQFRYFETDYVPGAIHKFRDHAGDRRIKLVLDGQQRLSSIYVALRGTYDERSLHFDVLSGREIDDYSEEKFDFSFLKSEEANQANSASRVPSSAGQPNGELPRCYVRINEVIGKTPNDIFRMRQRISERYGLQQTDQLRMETNLHGLSHALSGDEEILKTQTIDSKLPSNDEKRKSAFDILEIFVRINTQGVRLSRSDLIVSMLRLYWKEASEVLPRFVKEINEGSGLEIDNDFIIRCMFATAGLGTRLDFELLRKKTNVDKIKSSYRACFDAIRAVVDFVRTDCHIDSSRLLGGIGSLVPFVYYLYHAPKHSFPLGSKAEARRALYLFAFSKVFTQFSESRTGSYIRSSLPADEQIRAGATFPYAGALKFVHFKSNFDPADDRLFANNRELALSLLQRKAGGKVKFAGNLPEIDHIFPQAALNEKGFEWHEIDNLGNLWILPRTLNRNKGAIHPKSFLKGAEPDYLKIALIDFDRLDFRGYRAFVRDRRAAIASRLREATGIREEDLKDFAGEQQALTLEPDAE